MWPPGLPKRRGRPRPCVAQASRAPTCGPTGDWAPEPSWELRTLAPRAQTPSGVETNNISAAKAQTPWRVGLEVQDVARRTGAGEEPECTRGQVLSAHRLRHTSCSRTL